VAAQIAFGIGLIPIGIRVLRQSGAPWEVRAVQQLPTTVS
jgi:hypothetical protein